MDRFVRGQHPVRALRTHNRGQTGGVVFVVQHCASHVPVRAALPVLVHAVHEVGQLGEEVRVLRELVEDQVSDALEGEPAVEVGPLGVEEEMRVGVEEQVPSLGNVLVLGVLADLVEIQIGLVEPVTDLDIVEVRRDKDGRVEHHVLHVLGHDLGGEVGESVCESGG